MVRFSCFHAQIHPHKQKNPVQMSAEAMQKSLEDHSQNHSMKDFSYCQANSPSHLNEESDAVDGYAGHVIDSSSNDHDSKSEENGDDYKSECNPSVDQRKAGKEGCVMTITQRMKVVKDFHLMDQIPKMVPRIL
ncbi:PREDICTED: uncharacterized protein LOC109151246 [Ipomoea nil]|uniref:uncharacterized protein LOC109151246 n=1 Tax=Ipomoea nil TaxID=35883 RepID=UPI0009010C25|nr:PREDICTED: uncharacterized protein LOC109151246 [Ipomoea nil]